MKYYLISLL